MRKLCILALMYALPSYLLAQIWGSSDTPVYSITLGPTEAAEYTPVFAPDDSEPPVALEGDRSVIWVHGLGGHGDDAATGEENSWIQASATSDITYQMASRRPDYNDVSLDAATTSLRTEIEDYSLTPDAFIIAHSQGGIVSRRLDQYIDEFGWTRTFNGLATFGTPHQGAMILNNRDDLQDWIETTCVDLTEGPYVEALVDLPFFALMELLFGISDYNDLACDLISEKVLPFVFSLDEYYAGVTSAYMVGSETLTEMNEYETSIPYVAFWGEETEPVMWNTLVHMLPGRSPNSEVYGPFGASNDSYLTEKSMELFFEYLTKYLTYLYGLEPADYKKDLIDFLSIGTVLKNWILMHAWSQGYNWFLTANDVWKVLIGGTAYEPTGEAVCFCYDTFGSELVTLSYETTDDLGCYFEFGECVYMPEYATVEKINDGIVTMESAANMPGMVGGGKMEGSNHFSMRNDGETEKKLDELYFGTHSLFFKIENRE